MTMSLKQGFINLRTANCLTEVDMMKCVDIFKNLTRSLGDVHICTHSVHMAFDLS